MHLRGVMGFERAGFGGDYGCRVPHVSNEDLGGLAFYAIDRFLFRLGSHCLPERNSSNRHVIPVWVVHSIEDWVEPVECPCDGGK